MEKNEGDWLSKLLGWGCLAFILLMSIVIVVPQFLLDPHDHRHHVVRIRADQRSLATALESYFIDHQEYPAMTYNPQHSIDAELAKEFPTENWRVPTFMQSQPTSAMDAIHTLTTPVTYISKYFADGLAFPPERSFAYYATTDPPGWMIWSAGPDGDYDLLGTEYDLTTDTLSNVIIENLYDPTNGRLSSGDVVRIRQWPDR